MISSCYVREAIRQPAVVGQFYPANATQLRSVVDAYLAAAHVPPVAAVRAVVAPHASYPCSGRVAAFSFKALARLPDVPYTIYLLGPTHWLPVYGVGLSSATIFATPLGSIPVAERCNEELLGLGEPYHPANAAHAPEHCLEVHLPFLQRVLHTFSIVPILLDEKADPIKIGADLARLVATDPQALIVVSSDLSHYYPYEQAIRQDEIFLQDVVAGAWARTAAGRACGLLAILTLMEVAARLGWRAHRLAYGNSGDTCGSKAAVVGYGALAYTATVAAAESM